MAASDLLHRTIAVAAFVAYSHMILGMLSEVPTKMLFTWLKSQMEAHDYGYSHLKFALFFYC